MIRSCQRPGLRLGRKKPDTFVASLRPDGSWFTAARSLSWYAYEPVEVAASTLEVLATELQSLRDAGPDVQGTCVRWRVVNSGLTQSLNREWVLECIVLITDREGGAHFPFDNERTVRNEEGRNSLRGPLQDFRTVILEYCAWFLGRSKRFATSGDVVIAP